MMDALGNGPARLRGESFGSEEELSQDEDSDEQVPPLPPATRSPPLPLGPRHAPGRSSRESRHQRDTRLSGPRSAPSSPAREYGRRGHQGPPFSPHHHASRSRSASRSPERSSWRERGERRTSRSPRYRRKQEAFYDEDLSLSPSEGHLSWSSARRGRKKDREEYEDSEGSNRTYYTERRRRSGPQNQGGWPASGQRAAHDNLIHQSYQKLLEEEEGALTTLALQQAAGRIGNEQGQEMQGSSQVPGAVIPSLQAPSAVPCVVTANTLQCATKPPRASSVRRRNSTSGQVRVATWNVEWMYHLFRPGLPPQLLPSNPDCGIVDTKLLCKQISGLIRELDPDLLIVVEGPEYLAQLQEFVRMFLDDGYQCFGLTRPLPQRGLDGDHQRIYIIVKRDGPIRCAQLDEETHTFLSKEWMFDIDGDLVVQSYHFTRVPLVVRGQVMVDGVERQIYFIGIHCKSKHVKKAEKLRASIHSHENTEFIRKAVKNRKRIAAECARLRKCIDQCIFSKEKDPLVIVAGDLNDGPGMDFFEEYYLLFDSVEALLGSPFYQKKLLQPILIHKRFVNPADQWTASFYDPIDGVEDKQVLIDHICVSKPVYRRVTNAGIAHDLKEKYERKLQGYQGRQGRVSDHAPCFIDAF